MSFSIVTVALNAADDLALTFESILQQDFGDFELIFVDGGSWDHTPQIVERYLSHIDKVVRIEDAGIFYAMNEAVKYCSKEYVLFMNAKDRFFSGNVLSKVWVARENNPDVMFGDHVYVNGRVEALTRARLFESTRRTLRNGTVTHRWHNGIPCHQATFTRVSLLRELQYDTRLEICADHDFLFRASESGARYQYIDEVICHYMGGGYSAMRIERCKQEFAYVYRRYSEDPAAVDRLFYQDAPSPFSSQTKRTGMILSGTHGSEGPSPEQGIGFTFSWVPARGFDTLSPSGGSSYGVAIKGINRFPGQVISAVLDGRRIGHATISEGGFDIEVSFSEPVPPQSLVQFMLSRYGALPGGDGRFVCIATSAVTFKTIDEDVIRPLHPETTILFNVANSALAKPLLLSGWDHFELGHIWSIGPQAQMLIAAVAQVASVELVLSANPFVSENDRAVDVRLNGEDLERHVLEGNRVLTIDCKSEPWIPGKPNLISLHPAAVASPPEDPRMLGVCLHAIRVN